MAVKANTKSRDTSSDKMTAGKKKTVDSVLSASNLVVHRHANRDVVGGSRVEDHVTDCAIRSVGNKEVGDKKEGNSQELVWECDEILPTQQLEDNAEIEGSDEEDEFVPLTNMSGKGKKV